jgi:hypothetical protein
VERADRNWTDLLQELRVTQTGVQVLTAFLLSLPFQQRFSGLSDGQRWLYLVVVLLAVAATALLLTPVSIHRAVFRHREKQALVVVADRVAKVGLAVLALAITGAVALIFDVVRGTGAAIAFGAGTLVLITLMWAAIPAAVRRRGRRDV